MFGFSSALEYQSVPHHVFKHVRRSLSCLLPEAVYQLSEKDLSQGQPPLDASVQKFTLLSTGRDSLLLMARPDGAYSYWVCLCTQPAVIANFLSLPWLVSGLGHHSQAIRTQLQQGTGEPSGLSLDSRGLLKLSRQLILEASGLERLPSAQVSPLSATTILQDVSHRLHQSESLSSIVQSALDQACQWLRLDRLLIYQLVDSPPNPAQQAQTDGSFPHITYEARAHPTIDSVLHVSDASCFTQASWHQRYARKSQAVQYYAIEDVASHYQQHCCFLTQLQRAGVTSQIIVPMWQEETLWGLLIAHHCTVPHPIGGEIDAQTQGQNLRHWQPWEGNFLVRMAEQLMVAVRQTDLQQQLQHQKLILKAQVEERTQNLKDALVAAEAANKTKSEFLATMSHELRTPLTYIIGMSATLLRWSFGELSPRQRDYLNTIHSSGEQLLDIINDILEVAKIEAGRTVLEINDFSLSNLTRSSLESFREEAQEKGVDLRINLRLSETEDIFRADPRRIRQILANLLSNAVKFTDKGGRISLRVWRDPQNVLFQVEDTGIGIPEPQQAILFETFKQLETARQRQYPGAGLGLALTKQLIELHNGSIQVVSTPGKGSMFTVRIPLQHSDDLSTPFHSAEPVTGRIILLEDDESSASLICDLLTAANYQVIWVIEGSRIVHQVEILQPVAIILNHHLVSGNSQYIVDDLKHYVATSGIKIISLMDAGDKNADGAESEPMAGFDDYLIKPIDPPTLLSKIQVLSTGRAGGDT
ncbi:MAG: ATP-binding protein [Cyanobacteria bacterium P01_H01_bin.26]